MRKHTLLEQAKSEHIHLTESMLRRFVEYGLVLSQREGEGRKGVSARYDESSLRVIREIKKLEERLEISQKDMIFLLFWRGYPVHLDKMKEQLQQFVHAFTANFRKIAEHPEKDDIHDAALKLAEKSIPVQKSGRPSNTQKQWKQNMIDKGTRQRLMTVKLITEFSKLDSLSFQTLSRFLTSFGSAPLPIVQEVYENTLEQLQLSGLARSINRSAPQDYEEIYQLIGKMTEYWADISQVFPNPGHIPLAGDYIKLLGEICNTEHPADDPTFIKLLLIVVLSVPKELRRQAKALLFAPNVKQLLQIALFQLSLLGSPPRGKGVTS
ncbi:hypothetical protein ACFFNY_02250 [Paenibacillus hodogayensis]|uniref:MerR family transcriptional regulator n=1 Tax=Paenibacillus hodogayensis TaxID=279208 RepID=A0ABV5VQ73_9BACL